MDDKMDYSKTVKNLEMAEEKLFGCFMSECDAGRYYEADKVVSLLKRLDIV